MKKIAFIGATGMLGRPVAQALIEAGFELTLLVRNLDKAKQMFGEKVRYIEGDLKAQEAILALLANNEGLYINLSVEQASAESDYQPERDSIINLLSAASAAGIKRIGYLSSLIHLYDFKDGKKWWVFELKREAVRLIKTSGIPSYIFYPSTFMESFTAGGYRQGKNIMLAGDSQVPMYLIAGVDYGRQVAKAFALDGPSKDYIIQGTEAFTADQAAAYFVKYHKQYPVKILKMPFWMLKLLAPFSNKFKYGVRIIEALNHYLEKFEGAAAWDELGKPQTSFKAFIEGLK